MQNPANFINAHCPTVQDVVDLAMNPRKARPIIMSAQFRLLDLNLNPYPLPVPLDPNDPSAMCSFNKTGYIENLVVSGSDSDDVPRKCTFIMHEFPGIGQFKPLKLKARTSTQYWQVDGNGNATVINEIPTGTFLFTIPDRDLDDPGNVWTITGHCELQRVKDLGFENDFTLPVGIDAVMAVQAMLLADQLPPGEGGRSPLRACGGTGGCVGCAPASGTGTGQGYCQQGYALTDPQSGSMPYSMSTVLRQRGATGFPGLVLYNTTIGMKIDATTGAPIDPWSCRPMKVEVIAPGEIGSAVPGEIVPGEMVLGDSGGTGGSFPAFILSRKDTAGNEMYVDTTTGKVYDTITGIELDPITGNPGTVLISYLFKRVLPLAYGTGTGDGGLAVAQGNGFGYSPSFGWAVNDVKHALAMQAAPGSSQYLHWVPESGENIYFLYVAGHSGMKIDAATGHVVDPWNMQPMPYATTGGASPSASWAQPLFLASQLAPDGVSKLYLDPATALWYTWDGVQTAGHLTQVFPQWNGVSPTPPDTVFQLAGGDGGVSSLPRGAVGPQTGSVGAYIWPDPNNPGLTPSCCPHSGPNFPAYRIFATPSPAEILDPDSMKMVKGDPHLKNTLPFTPKDNLLKSVDDLLDSIIYWPLYDDELGNIYLSPLPYVDGTIPQPDANFHYETSEDGVILPHVKQVIADQTTLFNKVIVRSENAKTPAICSVQYNRSDYSWISVQNWGRVVQKQPVIQLDTITDQTVLALRAFVEINLAALPSESVEMTVLMNPFIQQHDVLALYIWSPDGQTLEISSHANPFLITAWEHDYDKMTTKLTMGHMVPV